MVSRSVGGLLFLLAVAYSNPTPEKLLADADYRLPTSVVPTKYTIALTFPEAAFTKDGTEFQGVTTIDFTVNVAITEIKFHLANNFITVTKLTIQNLDLDPTRGDYTIDPTTDILTIPTEGMTITAGGSYKMVVTYVGKISTTDNYGIYKSSYTNEAKETVYLLATQFESTYARRAFPCFDEPSFKATYDVSVSYPSATKDLKVLFNTEQTAVPTLADGIYTVSFKTTPKMSSYLVALTVSDFTSTAGTSISGTSYAVWSRIGTEASRAYAVEVGPTILQKLNEYTGFAYGTEINKADQIALPDMSAGAMENWGLVTYRERYLLWNTEDSSTNAKENILTIMAHELAHQWFGNIITCDWWSVTFLNEGFATYFQYFIGHQVEPTWALDKQFVVNVVQLVLASDASTDSQALQSDAFTPLQISSKFGVISYQKGGSIIRMLTHIMGEANFQAGIQEYFQTTELRYSTSVPSKLWEIMQNSVKTEVSVFPEGVTLTNVMQNWVEQAGYPVLTVTLDGTTLKISQERFLLTGEDKETKWYVPITYVESTSATKFLDTKPTAWLTPDTPEITVTLTNDNSWVLLNPLQTGYFRVNYDTNLWKNIAEALKKTDFDGIVDLNRAHLVDDLFSLAQANKLTYSEVFNTIDFLRIDTSYYSWVPAFKGFSFLMQRIAEGTEIRTSLQAQILDLSDALYKSVSFDDVNEDDQIYTFRQGLAISWACNLGEEDCVTKAKAAFSEYKEKGTKPNKNLKSAIFCTALRTSEDSTDYDFLWTVYTGTEVSTEKNTILSSLGCSSNQDKLKELLTEAIKEDSQIKMQDSLAAFAAVYGGSATGAEVALDFLVTNLPAVLQKYPSTSSRRSLVTGIAGKLTSDAHVAKLTALVETSADFPSDIKEEAQKALVQAQSNIKWIEDHQADLNTYFDISTTTTTTTTAKPGGANAVHINLALVAIVTIFSMLGFLRE